MQKLWTRLIGATLVVLVITSSSIGGGLLNYDDERYISGNPWLEMSQEDTDEPMFTAYFDGHYHPLTLLSLKMDESLGNDPIKAHHRTNWLLHGANAFLIGFFIFLLIGDIPTAVGVTLIWGLHPLAVESYAWMTERKNVLYSLFFLLSAIQYLKYRKSDDKKNLGYTALFFILSCLAKGQGILLLPVFFLIDYFEKSSLFDKSKWMEKAGFLVIALVFAFLNRQAQAEAWDLGGNPYELGERLILGTYAFAMYAFHTIIPIDLIPYVPYPTEVDKEIGGMHYIGIPVVLGYLAALYLTYRKGLKVWFFGLAWFGINIVLMLKILEVPYGNYILADRYAYLPMLGLLLPIIYAISQRLKSGNSNTAYIVLAVIGLAFGWLSRNQIGYWESSTQLWGRVLEDYPTYGHAGNMYALGALQEGDVQEAIRGFQNMINQNPSSPDAYVNLAILYEQQGQTDKADQRMNQALDIDMNSETVLSKAPILMFRRGQVKRAFDLGERGIELYPDNVEIATMYARAAAQLELYDEALNALEPHADDAEAQPLMQTIQQLKNNPGQVEADRARAQAERLTQEGVAAAQAGNDNRALQLFSQAISTDPSFHSAYANRGSYYAQNNRLELAKNDFLKADELAPRNGQIQAMLGKLFADLGDTEKSCEYYLKAVEIGVQINPALLQECR